MELKWTGKALSDWRGCGYGMRESIVSWGLFDGEQNGGEP